MNSNNELLRKKEKLERNARTYAIKRNEHKMPAAKQLHVRRRQAKIKNIHKRAHDRKCQAQTSGVIGTQLHQKEKEKMKR